MKVQYAIRYSIPDHHELVGIKKRNDYVRCGLTKNPITLEWGEKLQSMLEEHTKAFDAVYPGTSVEIVSLPAPRLKAGTATGSLINHVASGDASPLPAVGQGATILSWSDRRAATVVSVAYAKNGQPIKIEIVEDEAKPLHVGMTDAQEYDYSPGVGLPRIFTLRPNGAWVALGDTAKSGQRIILGIRETYHDFSF